MYRVSIHISISVFHFVEKLCRSCGFVYFSSVFFLSLARLLLLLTTNNVRENTITFSQAITLLLFFMLFGQCAAFQSVSHFEAVAVAVAAVALM